MSGEAYGSAYRGDDGDGIDWEGWGRSLRRTAFLGRTFAIALAASIGAQALVGLWRWLRRPPGG